MLDETLRETNTRKVIDAALLRIQQALHRRPADLFGWEVVPLDVFTGRMPLDVGSAWIFVIRAGIPPEKHRHPNSRQRTISYLGAGDLQVYENGVWISNVLVSGRKEPRCVSIPAGAWHKPVVNQDWVVVSFHTAMAEDLSEESGEEKPRTRTYSG